jgi:hypothetical protein
VDSTALIAQYAPKIPKITLRIAVVLSRKPTKSAFKVRPLGAAASWTGAAANDLLYPHLTPAVVNN